jgi:hypothetical protein
MILARHTLQLGPKLFLLVGILAPSQAWTSIPHAPKASDISTAVCLTSEHGAYKMVEGNTGILGMH